MVYPVFFICISLIISVQHPFIFLLSLYILSL
jgi:hypothetical protein